MTRPELVTRIVELELELRRCKERVRQLRRGRDLWRHRCLHQREKEKK
jgi:hypothetical protein